LTEVEEELDEVVDTLDDVVVRLALHGWIGTKTLLTGFLDLAMVVSFVIKDSNLEPFLIRSISNGFRFGRVFTACDSKRIRKAPTNMAV